MGAVDRRAFLAKAASAGVVLAIPGCASAKRRKPLARTVPRRLEQAMRGHVFERGLVQCREQRDLAEMINQRTRHRRQTSGTGPVPKRSCSP